MKRPLTLTASLSAAAVVLALGGGAAQASDESAQASARYARCGHVIIMRQSGAGFGDVRAKGLNCGRARTTLRRWALNRYQPRTGPVSWRCPPHGPASRVVCTRGTQRISFISGT